MANKNPGMNLHTIGLIGVNSDRHHHNRQAGRIIPFFLQLIRQIGVKSPSNAGWITLKSLVRFRLKISMLGRSNVDNIETEIVEIEIKCAWWLKVPGNPQMEAAKK